MSDPCLSDLAPPARRLVETMRKVNFGLIENLEVRSGLPVFEPPPRLVRDIKLGRGEVARAEPADADFALKPEVLELLDLFSVVGDGSVLFIEVLNGLPRRVRVCE